MSARLGTLFAMVFLGACSQETQSNILKKKSEPTHVDSGGGSKADDWAREPEAGAQPVCPAIGVTATFDNGGLCDQCMQRSCCEQVAACFTNSTCAALVDCERECVGPNAGDDEEACITGCRTRSNEVARKDAFVSCKTAQCPKECVSE